MNNDFKTTFDDTQLEDMRQQMAALKRKLERQEVVNDQLIRQMMKRNVSSLNRRTWVLTTIALLMIPYGYWAFVMLNGFSIAFWIATCILMLTSAGVTFYISKDVLNHRLLKNDLMDVRLKMARAKKFNAQWLLYSIPAIILWFVWFCYEAYKRGGTEEMNALLFSGGIGGIIGGIIGLRVHFKTQRQYQNIIDQIEEITREDQHTDCVQEI